MKTIFLISCIAVLLIVASFNHKRAASVGSVEELQQSNPIPTPTRVPYTLPGDSFVIPVQTHVFQTFNNCGPATLSMLLSYMGQNVSQKELGDKLRPYQNTRGDNDDKSVTFAELAQEARKRGLYAYHRPNGDIEKLKLFMVNGIPVGVRTWLNIGEDIGHYRVVRGYDETRRVVIQDDSYQYKDSVYSYDDFMKLWQGFNYEYLVIITPDKKERVEAILGDELDERIAWEKAYVRAKRESENDSLYPMFNQVVANVQLGNYEQAIQLFETIQHKLPQRMLWYQTEPITAYLKTGNYPRVFAMTDKILSNHNRAFSELYLLRGEAHLYQNNMTAAKQEFEKAIFYNTNLQSARDALQKIKD